MIIQIRGTSGSGKSTVVRKLMEKYGSHALYREKDDKPIGYLLGNGVFVVGRYETPCGGCDAIATQDEIGARVKLFASTGGNVLFEGLLASEGVTRYISLAEALKPAATVFSFLDTPLETCLARVGQRRTERGETEEFNPENTKRRFETVQRAMKRLEEAGLDVRVLPHDSAPATIAEWFKTDRTVTGTELPQGIFTSPQQGNLFG